MKQTSHASVGAAGVVVYFIKFFPFLSKRTGSASAESVNKRTQNWIWYFWRIYDFVEATADRRRRPLRKSYQI